MAILLYLVKTTHEKYLTINLLAHTKLLLEHREENIEEFLGGRPNYNQFSATQTGVLDANV